MTVAHVVTDPAIPAGRFILEGVNVEKAPLFSVSELAKVFFGRSSYWVRWLEEQHAIVLDGDPQCSHTKTAKEMRPHPIIVTEAMQKRRKLPADTVGKPLLDKDGNKVTEEKMTDVQVPYFDTKGKCKRCKGQKVGERRTASGARTYSLADVEQVAHALAQAGKITGTQLRHALGVVDLEARIWEYI